MHVYDEESGKWFSSSGGHGWYEVYSNNPGATTEEKAGGFNFFSTQEGWEDWYANEYLSQGARPPYDQQNSRYFHNDVPQAAISGNVVSIPNGHPLTMVFMFLLILLPFSIVVIWLVSNFGISGVF